jgi:alanine dehydrogenase
MLALFFCLEVVVAMCIIGVPKEIKNNENRVGMTPAGVSAYKQAGHRVLVEAQAGAGSGFADEDYVAAGAEILDSAEQVWQQADMICKVKEPLPQEYILAPRPRAGTDGKAMREKSGGNRL